MAAARRAARAGADPRHFRRLPRPTQRALWHGAQVWRRSAHQQKVSSEGRGRRQQRRGGTRPASCGQPVRWSTLKSLRKPRSGRLASASAMSSRPRRLGHPGVLRERCRLQNGGCGSAFHAPLFSNSKAGTKPLRNSRPLRGSVSCGRGWSVPCVSIQLTLSQVDSTDPFAKKMWQCFVW